jgi:8-oxo-dGTP pyrophosphatase MutT (NUDIX family)
LAWGDWGFPDRSVVNCFAMAALLASDGAYLLGVMSTFTANPGRIYFPAGTPDPSDIRGDTVDLLGNVLRELGEETGLGAQDLLAAPDWTAVVAGPRIALMKEVRARRPAAELRASILGHLASEARPELADMWIVRSPADFDPAMPEFVTAYLSHVWRQQLDAGAFRRRGGQRGKAGNHVGQIVVPALRMVDTIAPASRGSALQTSQLRNQPGIVGQLNAFAVEQRQQRTVQS